MPAGSRRCGRNRRGAAGRNPVRGRRSAAPGPRAARPAADLLLSAIMAGFGRTARDVVALSRPVVALTALLLTLGVHLLGCSAPQATVVVAAGSGPAVSAAGQAVPDCEPDQPSVAGAAAGVAVARVWPEPVLDGPAPGTAARVVAEPGAPPGEPSGAAVAAAGREVLLRYGISRT